MGSNGVFSSYSSFGANVFCTAPSDSFFPYTFGILAPDRRGAAGYNTGVFDLQNYDIFPDPDYTSIFGGTSASAPLIAGVMALAKQANPNMNVRFAKHLLAMTSRVIHANDTTDTSDGGWKTNAAGYRFNQNYGFGLVHADRFAWEAGNWQGVTDLVTHTTGTVTFSPAINIPDADQNGNPGQVIRTFNVPNTQTTPLEVVKVRLEMTHTYRGDLEVYLTSPSGTTSRLFSRAAADADAMVTWTFITNAFWGERPAGTWTIRVLDTARLDTGTWRSYRVDMNLGRLFSVPLATQLVPANAAENGPDTPLTVNGRYFTPVSVITWNGAPLPTTFISSTQLRTTIPGSSLTPAGIAQVGVVTPAPGGTSAPLRFWIGPFLAVSFVSGPTRHPVTRNVTATIRVTNTGDRPMSNVVVPKVYFWRDNELAARHSNENNIVLGDLAVGASQDFAISYNNVSIAEGQRCRFRFDTTFTGGKQDQTLIFYMPK
jgi:subtilisin-like proprotein convertase family protein